MGKLFLNITGWIVRKFGLLLLLIAGLLLAPSVMDVWRVVGEFDPVKVAKEITKQVEELVPGKSASKEESERALKMLREKLERKKAEHAELAKESCFLPACSLVKAAKLYRVDMETAILEQAVTYGEALSIGTKACNEVAKNEKLLNDRKRYEAELESGRPILAPRVKEHRDQKAQIEDLTRTQNEKEKQCQTYQRLSKTFEANQNVAQQKIGEKYRDSLVKLEGLKQSRFALWQSVQDVFKPALNALLAIMFVPIGVKLFAYYGVANLASRKFGVRLLPDTSGELKVVSAPHDLQRIDLERGSELLIDPALLRSSPESAVKSTKLLLDWSMPLSSIATGQYLLTCIRGDGTVTISDDKDNMSKLTVLDLPENAALVLQPRCLAGIVQSVDRPIRITRHWRLGHIGSWLTLQLRYVVFHGPAKLIVRGNHGVEADAAQAGSSINQAATLGFSANLGYGVTRCETFYAYLSGKKELFNDCFSSGPGSYVHEVRPHPATKTLLPGRGIEGILDLLLKPFGL